MKLNPNLFYMYEKMNKSSKGKEMKASADGKLVEVSKENSREAASENLSSRFRGPNNLVKSNLRLRAQAYNDDDVQSWDAQRQPGKVESRSAYRLGGGSKLQEPIRVPHGSGPSRSQAHTAHTNQRLKPGKLNRKDKMLDGTLTEDAKTNKTSGAGGKRHPTTYIVN